MASKSKKRRRVFRASCILAALIIAGSSFAWFTSQDEVTNRLTASSDYGVSIVESFAPPMNWIPGQEINKDVYAVNTGSIEAFVKEDLSGVLEYSFEYLVEDFDETCVTLKDKAHTAIDGATTNEAGGFLAWTSAEGVETGYVNIDKDTGYINSARPDDEVANRWVPTVAGDYIFRRSIGTDDEGNAVYTYAGYHFEPGATASEDDDKYYKIVIGSDPFRAAETYAADDEDDADGSTRFVFDISVDGDKLGNGATAGENGVITGTPKIQYVQIENVPATDVSFKYNEGTTGDDNKYDGAPYLEVRFSNTQGDMSAKTKAVQAAEKALADAQKALADAEVLYGPSTNAVSDAEVEYYNALYAYYTAKSRYDKTNADYTYANALITATNKLYVPAYKRYTAEKTKEAKLEALQTAMTNLKTEITHEYTETTDNSFTSFSEIVTAMTSTTGTKIGSHDLIPGDPDTVGNVRYEVKHATDNGGTALTNVENNLAALDEIWARIAGSAGDGTGGILKDIKDDYDNFVTAAATNPAGDKTTDIDPDTLEKAGSTTAYYQKLLADIDKLEELLDTYAKTYTALKTAADEAHLTNIDLDNATEATNKAKIEAFYKKDTSTNPATESGSVQDLEARIKLDTDVVSDSTVTGLKGRIDDYREKYNDYYTYMANPYGSGVDETTSYYWAVDKWAEAITTYNSDVSSAKTTYDNAIKVVQDTRNAAVDDVTITDDSGKLTLVNDGLALVNDYSAHYLTLVSDATETDDGDHSTSDADPQITTDADKLYTNYLASATPSAAKDEVALKTTANFTQLNKDPNGSGDSAQTLQALATDLGDAGSGKTKAKNDELADYEAAKTAATSDLAALKAAQDAVTAAQTNLTRAQNAVAAQNTMNSTSRSNIDIDVVLDKNVVKSNADDITTNATWVFDVSTDQTTNPTFYYNRIVAPGDTTNKLVDKLVFCDTVTSEDYVDLTFDLNVGMDSAQALYDNATHRQIITDAVDANDAFAMDAAVAADNQKVTWTSAAPAPAPAPTTTNVDVIVDGAEEGHNLIKMVKTGTGDSATWAVADSGSTVENAAEGHHYTINGAGEYRNVTLGLIPALNAVTGDTTPVVAYVAD